MESSQGGAIARRTTTASSFADSNGANAAARGGATTLSRRHRIAIADALSCSLAELAAAGQHARLLAAASHCKQGSSRSLEWDDTGVMKSPAVITPKLDFLNGTVERSSLGEDLNHTVKSKARSQEAQLQLLQRGAARQLAAGYVGATSDRITMGSPSATTSYTTSAGPQHLPHHLSTSIGSAASCSSLSNGLDTERSGSLLPPYREPCFSMIQQTFNKFVQRAARKSLKRDHSLVGQENEVSVPVHIRRDKRVCRKRALMNAAVSPQKESKSKKILSSPKGLCMVTLDSIEEDVEGSSVYRSEGSYFGSNSSNCSLPLSDSSDASGTDRMVASPSDLLRSVLYNGRESPLSVSSTSSEISDFISSSSYPMNTFQSQTGSPSSSNVEDDNSLRDVEGEKWSVKQKQLGHRWPMLSWQLPVSTTECDCDAHDVRQKKAQVSSVETNNADLSLLQSNARKLEGKPPIMALGCEVMAHVLTFLEPTETLDVLTMPLSKDWLNMFTRQPELWQVLCLLEPFKGQLGEEYDISDDKSDSSLSLEAKFRLLYTSYVRCMRCLTRIKDDVIEGRPLSIIDDGVVLGGCKGCCNIGANRNLQQLTAKARGLVAPGEKPTKERSTVRLNGLTQKPLCIAPSDNVECEVPWSDGIHSIINWMVDFSSVEGIQIMCLKVLPFLLENEQQRITAQRAGLKDIVLRDMVFFPESVSLHTEAFHTLVVLARPLGGQEGMLFHTSMVNSAGIFSSTFEGVGARKSGIAILLDSMRRFQSDGVLQAMSCWSLVNLALAPGQKEVMVKLGGIEAIVKAMMEHQYDAEVQFRAIFALINLAIPCTNGGSNQVQAPADVDFSEKGKLDDMVGQIVSLVVSAMKNFCSNEAILNRSCLVLLNLSLTSSYHNAMLCTPSCYQMLEWCLENYQSDRVLQRSAAGTLHRLQLTLSSDETLRSRFVASTQFIIEFRPAKIVNENASWKVLQRSSSYAGKNKATKG